MWKNNKVMVQPVKAQSVKKGGGLATMISKKMFGKKKPGKIVPQSKGKIPIPSALPILK